MGLDLDEKPDGTFPGDRVLSRRGLQFLAKTLAQVMRKGGVETSAIQVKDDVKKALPELDDK